MFARNNRSNGDGCFIGLQRYTKYTKAMSHRSKNEFLNIQKNPPGLLRSASQHINMKRRERQTLTEKTNKTMFQSECFSTKETPSIVLCEPDVEKIFETHINDLIDQTLVKSRHRSFSCYLCLDIGCHHCTCLFCLNEGCSHCQFY